MDNMMKLEHVSDVENVLFYKQGQGPLLRTHSSFRSAIDALDEDWVLACL